MKSTIKLSAVLFFVAVFGAVAGFSQGEKVALLNTNSGTQTASPRDAATDDLRVNARVLDSTSTGVGSALDHTTTGVDSVLGHTSPDATVKSNAGNVQVVNSVCVPQGPGPCSQPRQSKKSGHDGFSCPTKNLQGGNIRGTCKAGVCTAIAPSSCTTPSFTSSADSLKSGGFLGQLGQQFFSQLL
ncbi:MAG: hypothetical protein JKX80_01765 [Candidatus Pacebacteria bacterium]|nr:hypothetical protein [Candidatus Paceibacterota bacterium]